MPVVNYTTVNGQIVCENRAGVKTLFMPDTPGNVIETRNMDTGAQTSSTTYWPYGEVRTQTGTNPSPFGFCGVWGYYTQAGQPTYVRARYYRPHLGRWQTVDPLWPTFAPYEYAIGSPLQYIDRFGLASCAVQLAPSCDVPGLFGSCIAALCSWNAATEIVGHIKKAIKLGRNELDKEQLKKIRDFINQNAQMPSPEDCCRNAHRMAGRRIPDINANTPLFGMIYVACWALVGTPERKLSWEACAWATSTMTQCEECCEKKYPFVRPDERENPGGWQNCWDTCQLVHDQDVRARIWA